jgi:hypothetical protein
MNNKKTLFEISKDLDNLNSIIESLDELDIETRQQLSDAISQLFDDKEQTEQQFNDKVDSYIAIIKSCQYWSQIRKQELERIKKLVDTDEKTVEFLTKRLKEVLEYRNILKLKTTKFNVSIAKNGGKAPVVISDKVDMQRLPECFKTTTVEINKTAVREALENGQALDFASLIEKGTHLRIT